MSFPSDAFDPYRDWLGIDPREQPADYYRLLGVARFEMNLGAIAAAAEQRMQAVHAFQTGPRGIHSQRILNELATARACLLAPQSKAQYDAALHQFLTARMQPVYGGHIPGLGGAVPPPPPMYGPSTVIPPPVAGAAAEANVPPAEEEGNSRLLQFVKSWPGIIVLVVAGVVVVALATVLIGNWLTTAGKKGDQKPAAGTISTEGNPEEIDPGATSDPAAEATAKLPRQDVTGQINLPLGKAELAGGVTKSSQESADVLTGWTADESQAEWTFHVQKPGMFKLDITHAADPKAWETTKDAPPERGLVLELDGAAVKGVTLRPPAAGQTSRTDTTLVAIRQSGPHTLRIRVQNPVFEADWLRLKAFRLYPYVKVKPAM